MTLALALLGCPDGTDIRTLPVPVPETTWDGAPLTPGPDCEGGIGEPVSTCAGFVEGPADCGGTLVPASDDYPEHCEADTTLEEWCHTHLPCWEGPGCPNFHEFLWVSGWLDSDLPETAEYSWSSFYYAPNATTTWRCWYGDPPAVYDEFRWRYDVSPSRKAVFDVNGDWLAVVETDSCCGDDQVEERWWGQPPSHLDGCDHHWTDLLWEICAYGQPFDR